jgi:hypothetical protein
MPDDKDLLHGVPAIAAHLNTTAKAIYHQCEQGRLPVFRMGRTICARRSTLALHFAALEEAARGAGE